MSPYWKTIAFFVLVGPLIPIFNFLANKVVGVESKYVGWEQLPEQLKVAGVVFLIVGWVMAERQKNCPPEAEGE